jgi:GTP1/Obg family GTP-binding protein
MSCKAMLPKLRVSRIKLTSKHAVEVAEYILMGGRLRHASDRLGKMENVMEKYKKKLQEAADLRQAAKVRLSKYHRYLSVAESRSHWKNKMQIW